MANETAPRKHLSIDPDLVKRMNDCFVSIPNYGEGTLIFSTDSTKTVNYTSLESLGVVQAMMNASNKPVAIRVLKSGWLHIDGREGSRVLINNVVVARANQSAGINPCYNYVTQMLPIQAGMLISWVAPVPEGGSNPSSLELTFVPSVTI